MTEHFPAAFHAGIRRPAAVKVLLVVASLSLPWSPVFASQASAQFDVMITLRSAEKQNQTGQCNSTSPTNGTTTPTVVCDSKPAGDILASLPPKQNWPYEGRGYRFISYITGSAGSIDIFTAAGTSTAFRLVNWADREYIELTVGW